MSLAPRAVLVHRTTEYEELLARHGTHGQADYFLSSRGRSLADPRLIWFVREAWPSPTTGTSLVEGALRQSDGLQLIVESDRLVAFGDGIESDALELTWGQTVRIAMSDTSLHLLN